MGSYSNCHCLGTQGQDLDLALASRRYYRVKIYTQLNHVDLNTPIFRVAMGHEVLDCDLWSMPGIQHLLL